MWAVRTIIVILIFLLENCNGVGKTFIYDTDVSFQNNWEWVGTKNCSGLWFSEENDAIVDLVDLVADSMVLPKTGPVTLRVNGRIKFQKSGKCIKLKPMRYRDWDDYTNWRTDGANAAVPHLQRIPCDHDDVLLPPELFTRILTTRPYIPLKSLHFKNNPRNFPPLSLETIQNRFGIPTVIQPEPACKDESGCKCHQTEIYCPDDVTTTIKSELNCLNPIRPGDFCTDICGAYITFKPHPEFKMKDLEKDLYGYESHTYASLLNNGYVKMVQIVFAEEDFKGGSLDEAKDFYKKMMEKGWHGVGSKLVVSGAYYRKGEDGSNFGIVLGSFLGVVTVFALIFYLQGKDLERFTFVITRFSNSARTGFRDGFFARYNNTDENLIIENQSMAGSVLNLEKSFDNPMYGHSSQVQEEGQTAHENPLYNITLNEE